MEEKLFETLNDETLEKIAGGAGGNTPAADITFNAYGEPREGCYYAKQKPTKPLPQKIPGVKVYILPLFEAAQVTSVRNGTVQYCRCMFSADIAGWSARDSLPCGKVSTYSFKQEYPYELNVHD